LKTLSPTPNTDRSTAFAAALSFALAALAFAPALGAGFHPEDYSWLALGRFNDSPLPLLGGNIVFVYFYRPLGLLLWWLTAHVFGNDPLWHNAIDLILHATNATLLCLFSARLSGKNVAGWIAGPLFAALPAGVGTAAWMSDRFDPLALMFSLLALLAFTRAIQRNGRAWPVFLWLLLAMLSKEVAYATAGAMVVMLALSWLRRREFDTRLALAIVGAVVMALACRVLSGTQSQAANTTADAFLHGAIAWWQHAPEALTGIGNNAFALTTSVALLLLASMAAILLRFSKTERDNGEGAWLLLCSGTAQLALPAILQAPITALVLFDAPSLTVPENLRFYYFAAAGLATIVGACAALTPPKWAVAMLAATSIACVSGCVAARQQTAQWASSLRPMYETEKTLAADLSRRDFPHGCIIELDAPSWSTIQHQHSDSAIKALSAVDATLQHCAVFAVGQLPSEVLAPPEACSESYWPPGLTFGQFAGQTLARTTGSVCTLQFDRAKAPQNIGGAFRFRLDDDGHAIAQ
jgi:hypothetical protein